MKRAHGLWFILGILIVLLTGCVDPANPSYENREDPAAGADAGNAPFTVTVIVEGDGSVRTVSGPDALQIKGNIRNFFQVIAVDEESHTIVGFDEKRRLNADDTSATLYIEALTLGKPYAFLLLMGHWNRDYDQSGGAYVYKEEERPTLLAAGLTSGVTLEGTRTTVKITMYPLVVDTTFTNARGTEVEPPVTNGRPGHASVSKEQWTVNWTVKRPHEDQNGLTDLITAAGAGGGGLFAGNHPILRGTGSIASAGPLAITDNVITLDIPSEYTQAAGGEGSVNFNLEYVPFSLNTESVWSQYNEKSVFDLDGKPPVWIIRNGVNDKAQDNNTIFDEDTAWDTTKNGNGAVRFVVEVDESITFSNGSLTVTGSGKAEIGFILGGFYNNVDVYYAEVSADADVPDHAAYTNKLGNFSTGGVDKEINLSNAKNNVWLIAKQDKMWSHPYPVPHGGIFVGIAGTTVKYSKTGGSTWNEPLNLTAPLGNMAYVGGQYVLSKGGESVPTVSISNDGGASWSGRTLTGGPIASFISGKIAYGDGKFVMLNSSTSIDEDKIGSIYFDDRITTYTTSYTGPERWVNAAYGDGMFLAIGTNGSGSASMYSSDGTSWTKIDSSNHPAVDLICYLVYGDNKFVLLDMMGKVSVFNKSNKTWTNTTTLDFLPWTGLAYGGGRFAAVRTDGGIAWSYDAVTWTTVDTGQAGMAAISYGNGNFLAGTNDGRIYASINGETWTWIVQSDLNNGSLSLIYGEQYEE